MVKSAAVLVCSLLFSLGLAQTRESILAGGSISGKAVDSDGQPAKGIVLTAYPLGVALGTVLPATRTNDMGAYSFANIPWWGRFTVFASDEEAGYSQFSTGPSGHNPPEVSIDIDHPKARLDIYLPPKAGFLHIKLINSRTKLPISSMRVELRKAAEPTKFLFSIGCGSDHVVLIPPNEDLLLHVTSEGFKEWSESIDKGKPIHLFSGAQQELLVELEPSI
jgi:hypothetical protein